MRIFFITTTFLAVLVISIGSIVIDNQRYISYVSPPLDPNTSLNSFHSVAAEPTNDSFSTTQATLDYPKDIEISKIKLHDQLFSWTNIHWCDVRSFGTTSQVGWYKYGTLPGAIGNAVLDAHVFAAFANINIV